MQSAVSSHLSYPTRGRPRKDAAASATPVWQIQVTLRRGPAALEREALRRAAYIIGTNLLDVERWPDAVVIELYGEHSVVERGFAFLKDPLFLASSVFVKRPERIMALAFIMTLCLLLYKLAELRVRQRLAASGQTVPDQVRKPTARPTLRWLFQCFEGIDLLHISAPDGSRATPILRLDALHRRVLHLLGPAYENRYLALQQTAECGLLRRRLLNFSERDKPLPIRPRRPFQAIGFGLRETAPWVIDFRPNPLESPSSYPKYHG